MNYMGCVDFKDYLRLYPDTAEEKRIVHRLIEIGWHVTLACGICGGEKHHNEPCVACVNSRARAKAKRLK